MDGRKKKGNKRIENMFQKKPNISNKTSFYSGVPFELQFIFPIWQKFRDSFFYLANSQTNENPEIIKQ